MVVFKFAVYGSTTSLKVTAALAVVTIGLVLTTVTDVQLNVTGFALGVVAVMFTVLFQLGMEQAQQKFGVAGVQMQLDIAPWQFLICFVFALPLEVYPMV